MVQYLLFLFVHNTLSICICHWISKAQSRVRVCSSQGLFVAPRATSTTLPCQLCSGPSHWKICHIAICSLCLSYWQTEQFLVAFCASEGARGICLDSSLHCSSTPHIQVAISRERMGISAGQFQSPSKPGRPLF